GQTILVVEDEEDVRAYTTSILRELGYHIVEASVGAAALQMLQNDPEVMLLFTDLGLPAGLNGRQLADAARELRPDLNILFPPRLCRQSHGARRAPRSGPGPPPQAVHLCHAGFQDQRSARRAAGRGPCSAGRG